MKGKVNLTKKLKIKSMLSFMAAVAIVGIAFFAVITVVERFNIENEMGLLRNSTELSTRASTLVHELQKERGATALFLGSQGALFQSELEGQRKETDAKQKELIDFLSSFDASEYDAKLSNAILYVKENMERLDDIRSRVSIMRISTREAMAFYTNFNTRLIKIVSVTSDISSDSQMSAMFFSFISLLEAKERAGIERAVLSNTFARDSFAPGMFVKYIELRSLQEIFIANFKEHASDEWKNYYQTTYSGDAVDEVYKMEQVATEKAAEGAFGIDPKIWFQKKTDTINLLHKIENKFATDLLETAAQKQSRAVNETVTMLTIAGSIALLLIVVALFVIRTVSRSIADITNSVTTLSEQIDNGQLKERLNVQNVSIDFANIPAGINGLIDSILKPINESITVIKELSRGNLTVEVQGDYRGDHAIIKDSLNNTINSFNELLDQLFVGLAQIQSGSTQIADSSQTLSSGAAEQASSIEQMSASATQLAEQARMAAENSKKANEMSKNAIDNSEKGTDLMNEMVSAMSEIKEASESISKIMKTIDEIAFQTNLLALNAAVEAARAGKHGKGFAVVAEEVKNLSMRSGEAARETAEIIERSMSTTKKGVHRANDTADALSEIQNAILQMAQLVNEISNSSDEQLAGIKDVEQGLTQISHVTMSTAASSEETASASEEFTAQTKTILEMTKRFKLKNSRSNNAEDSRSELNSKSNATANSDVNTLSSLPENYYEHSGHHNGREDESDFVTIGSHETHSDRM